MVLVSGSAVLEHARKNKYAVPAFNASGFQITKAILAAAEEQRSPVMLCFTESSAVFMGGFKATRRIVEALMDALKISVPVALHLDHGKASAVREAVDAGFTSVMFDGSHFPIAENVKQTAEFVRLCHSRGISLEAEVGAIGGEEDGVIALGELADVDECTQIAKLNVDSLAAGIGNIHGANPPGWKGLDFPLLEKIDKATGDVALVLHGGSGIPEDMMKKAISMGVAKVNIGSEMIWAFIGAIEKHCKDGKTKGPGNNAEVLLDVGFQAVKNKAIEKIKMFGSNNQA